jgi:hypothetical protein
MSRSLNGPGSWTPAKTPAGREKSGGRSAPLPRNSQIYQYLSLWRRGRPPYSRPTVAVDVPQAL